MVDSAEQGRRCGDERADGDHLALIAKTTESPANAIDYFT